MSVGRGVYMGLWVELVLSTIAGGIMSAAVAWGILIGTAAYFVLKDPNKHNLS